MLASHDKVAWMQPEHLGLRLDGGSILAAKRLRHPSPTTATWPGDFIRRLLEGIAGTPYPLPAVLGLWNRNCAK